MSAVEKVADVLSIRGHGVRIIVTQGLLDNWFSKYHWGSIRPSLAAFEMAERFGLVERHATNPKYRLTDLGRQHRAALARQEQAA